MLVLPLDLLVDWFLAACLGIMNTMKRVITREEMLGEAAPTAQEFAISQHQQFGKPYDLTHIPQVVSLVAAKTSDPDVIAAAWLHDVVEDTGVSIETIRQMYGDRVAQIVWAVTDEPGANRVERKDKTLPKIAQNSDAALIKLADRVANVTASQGDERRLAMYRKEQPAFQAALQSVAPYDDMWGTLSSILGLPLNG
jgi:(p)ppGpp synthase/HD superfamily hydrolase